MRLNKELWLRFYIEDKVGMEYLSSIVFHTAIMKKTLKIRENKELWLRSSIKDKLEYLSYILATRTVWKTIDDIYSSFVLSSNADTFVGFASLDIFSYHKNSVEYYR